jgi:recombination protein RecA
MSFIDEMNKKFGEGTVIRLGQAPNMDVEAIPTGSLALDLALGIGGIPRGRITEIYGPESSGKTTLCQHIVTNDQKSGGHCLYIDMEHAFDLEYARACGVDVDALDFSQPDTGEQALDIAEYAIRSGDVTLVVIDSVATLVPAAEIEGGMGDSHMGLQARLMSQALRKLGPSVKSTNTALVFTNQLRMKIGVMFGNPETTTGGNALKFYASVRLDIRRRNPIKVKTDGVEEFVGNLTHVKVTKNKMAPPFREAEFDIVYAEGISKAADVLNMATKMDIVTKRGAFFSYGDEKLGQGQENAKQYLRDHPELLATIESAVRGSSNKAAAITVGTPTEE